tara:strand:+ start:947 stop:1768 length:822 start_codon:yes stop_codon:yes gene_type:complete
MKPAAQALFGGAAKGTSMSYSVVVPISGGKDSQACLKIALGLFPKEEVVGIFFDTKFEHPKTYKHIEYMKELYGVEIISRSAGSVPEKVLKYKRFPGGGARHCTDELKLTPSKLFYNELADKQGGYEVFLGMRWAESSERAKRYENKVSEDLYEPHEVMAKYPKYLGKKGVRFRLPIVDWSTEEVLDYLGGEQNPLYSEGFDRVGCFPCLASGDKWKEKAFGHDDFGRAQRIVVRNLEDEIGIDVFRSKGGCQRNNVDQTDLFDSPGCAICEI